MLELYTSLKGYALLLRSTIGFLLDIHSELAIEVARASERKRERFHCYCASSR